MKGTVFPEAMSRNRFRKITRFLRFDMRNTRLPRLQTGKFALISTTHGKSLREIALLATN